MRSGKNDIDAIPNYYFCQRMVITYLNMWRIPLKRTIISRILCATLISLYAMEGILSLKTIRLTGKMAGGEVSILMDSGSTHNFIQSSI